MFNQKVIKAILRTSALFSLAAVLLAFSGCSTLPTSQDQLLPTAAGSSESSGVYQVQMKGKFGKPVVSQGPIDGPITVQTVLERSGAVEKFRDMEITLLRVVQDSGRGLKLPIDYQAGDDSVRPEQDYAIHPNDQIMIEAKSNNAIDKIVDSVAR